MIAPLPAEVMRRFEGLTGGKVMEGYGLTECTSAATSNHFEAYRYGTVGQALPGFELRLAPDGELEMRSETIFAGYYKDEEATREAIDEGGWLHSGDVGELAQIGAHQLDVVRRFRLGLPRRGRERGLELGDDRHQRDHELLVVRGDRHATRLEVDVELADDVVDVANGNIRVPTVVEMQGERAQAQPSTGRLGCSRAGRSRRATRDRREPSADSGTQDDLPGDS